jgi:signal transduction histidine kinase
MFFNIFFYIVISVNDKPNAQELYQAEIFVNIYKHAKKDNQGVWKGVAFIPDLNALLENFLGAKRAKNLLQSYAQRNKIPIDAVKEADPRLVDFSEKILAGVIGSASARIMVRSITKEEEISIDGVLKILYESQQLIQLNKELRKKSSELTKATNALTKVNEQLKMIDISKDEFLYTVTHELRTPLTSIRALSEIVHDNPDMEEEQRMEFMSTIVKETERLSHLITQVLNLEKYENGKQRLNLNSFDIIGLAREASDSLKHLAGNKDIEIQLIYPNSSLLIHADEDLLRQVLLNLLSNAIKFSTKNNKIVLRIVDEQDEIGISIEDFGKGIPSAELPYIFDKFFQAHNQTLKKPQGSGLGLAICKKIIEMHNGKIWAESVEGKGSVFRFLIPNFGARKSEQ